MVVGKFSDGNTGTSIMDVEGEPHIQIECKRILHCLQGI